LLLRRCLWCSSTKRRPVAWKRELREEADRIRRRDERRAREEEDRKVRGSQVVCILGCSGVAWLANCALNGRVKCARRGTGR
jgi:hypothetical protein